MTAPRRPEAAFATLTAALTAPPRAPHQAPALEARSSAVFANPFRDSISSPPSSSSRAPAQRVHINRRGSITIHGAQHGAPNAPPSPPQFWLSAPVRPPPAPLTTLPDRLRPSGLFQAVDALELERAEAMAQRDEAMSLLQRVERACADEVETLRTRERALEMRLTMTTEALTEQITAQEVQHRHALARALADERELCRGHQVQHRDALARALSTKREETTAQEVQHRNSLARALSEERELCRGHRSRRVERIDLAVTRRWSLRRLRWAWSAALRHQRSSAVRRQMRRLAAQHSQRVLLRRCFASWRSVFSRFPRLVRGIAPTFFAQRESRRRNAVQAASFAALHAYSTAAQRIRAIVTRSDARRSRRIATRVLLVWKTLSRRQTWLSRVGLRAAARNSLARRRRGWYQLVRFAKRSFGRSTRANVIVPGLIARIALRRKARVLHGWRLVHEIARSSLACEAHGRGVELARTRLAEELGAEAASSAAALAVIEKSHIAECQRTAVSRVVASALRRPRRRALTRGVRALRRNAHMVAAVSEAIALSARASAEVTERQRFVDRVHFDQRAASWTQQTRRAVQRRAVRSMFRRLSARGRYSRMVVAFERLDACARAAAAVAPSESLRSVCRAFSRRHRRDSIARGFSRWTKIVAMQTTTATASRAMTESVVATYDPPPRSAERAESTINSMPAMAAEEDRRDAAPRYMARPNTPPRSARVRMTMEATDLARMYVAPSSTSRAAIQSASTRSAVVTETARALRSQEAPRIPQRAAPPRPSLVLRTQTHESTQVATPSQSRIFIDESPLRALACRVMSRPCPLEESGSVHKTTGRLPLYFAAAPAEWGGAAQRKSEKSPRRLGEAAGRSPQRIPARYLLELQQHATQSTGNLLSRSVQETSPARRPSRQAHINRHGSIDIR